MSEVNHKNDQDGINDFNDLRKFVFAKVWKRKILIILVTVSIPIFFHFYAYFLPQKYKLSSRIRVGSVNGFVIEKPLDASDFLLNPLNTQAVVESVSFPDKGADPESRVGVESRLKSEEILNLVVYGQTPESVQALSEGLVNKLLTRHSEIYRAQVDALKTFINNIDNDLDRIRERQEKGSTQFGLNYLEVGRNESTSKGNIRVQPYVVSEEFIQQLEQKRFDIKMSLLEPKSRPTIVIDADLKPVNITKARSSMWAIKSGFGAFILIICIIFFLR